MDAQKGGVASVSASTVDNEGYTIEGQPATPRAWNLEFWS